MVTFKKMSASFQPYFKAGIEELLLTPYNIYNNYYYLFMLIFSFIYNVHPNHEPSAEQAYVHTQVAKWVFLAHATMGERRYVRMGTQCGTTGWKVKSETETMSVHT